MQARRDPVHMNVSLCVYVHVCLTDTISHRAHADAQGPMHVCMWVIVCVHVRVCARVCI